MASSNILSRVSSLNREEDPGIVRIARRRDVSPDDVADPIQSRPDLRAALNLLDAAAETMESLHSRCARAEALLDEAARQAEAGAEALKTKLAETERHAQRLELELYNAELRMKELEARALTAEDRLEAAERRAAVAEQSTLEARNWLNSYYERITEQFGQRTQPRPGRAA